MPKNYTFPTFYDECKTVSITKLKEWGYLKPNQWLNGTITWSRNGSKYASIGISVNTFADKPYIEFDYKCNDEPIKYKVFLVSLHSNIGKGRIWYFLCPNTGKQCRKLYMVNTYFLHRSAFPNAMYEKQTYSKSSRQQFQLWSRLFDDDKIYEQLYSKYFKKTYRGHPTKRYLKLLNKLKQMGELSEEDLMLF